MSSVTKITYRLKRLPFALGTRQSQLDRLAADPVALAQILLLFRVVLVDGIVAEDELRCFEDICEREFGVPSADLPALHDLLESRQGHEAETQLFFLLKRLSAEARAHLIDLMQELADANQNGAEQIQRMIEMTARLLKMEPADA